MRAKNRADKTHLNVGYAKIVPYFNNLYVMMRMFSRFRVLFSFYKIPSQNRSKHHDALIEWNSVTVPFITNAIFGTKALAIEHMII